MKEYIYRRKSDGELFYTLEPIDNPEYELVTEVELGRFGGGRAVRRTDTGDTKKEEAGTA
jgi:hypothetical protein